MFKAIRVKSPLIVISFILGLAGILFSGVFEIASNEALVPNFVNLAVVLFGFVFGLFLLFRCIDVKWFNYIVEFSYRILSVLLDLVIDGLIVTCCVSLVLFVSALISTPPADGRIMLSVAFILAVIMFLSTALFLETKKSNILESINGLPLWIRQFSSGKRILVGTSFLLLWFPVFGYKFIQMENAIFDLIILCSVAVWYILIFTFIFFFIIRISPNESLHRTAK